MHFHRPTYPMEDLTGPEEFFCQLADLEEEYQRPPHRRPVRKKTLLAAALAGLTGMLCALCVGGLQHQPRVHAMEQGLRAIWYAH